MPSLYKWIVYCVAIAVATYLLPGIHVETIATTIVLALVLGALNTFVKPILVFFTLPLSVLTLGLFALVINAALVLLADYIVPGFSVDGFLSAVLFSIVLSVVRALLGSK